jgi:hypothetical protein
MLFRFTFTLAIALHQTAVWCQPRPLGASDPRASTPPAEAQVHAVSSIKRLTDATLSCAELQSRIEDLDRLSSGTAQRAESAAVDVEQARSELIAGTTRQAAPSGGWATDAAVTTLESLPIAGNLASSLITPPVVAASGPAASAQVHAAVLRSVMEAGKLQMTQYATAARRDHLHALSKRTHCAEGAP